jgi:hypothetical protein
MRQLMEQFGKEIKINIFFFVSVCGSFCLLIGEFWQLNTCKVKKAFKLLLN